MTDFYDTESSAFAPIDFRAELNDEQYNAVTAEPGPALVLAGAGSGKTRTLTYRVAYLLHKDIKPYEILLLTFTNKSAKEMLERVEELTGVKKHQLWEAPFTALRSVSYACTGNLSACGATTRYWMRAKPNRSSKTPSNPSIQSSSKARTTPSQR